MTTDYSKCKIVNIRRGKGSRSVFIYAELVDEENNLVIGATLDYILEALEDRLPGKKEDE